MEKEIAKQGEVLLYSDDNGKEFVNEDGIYNEIMLSDDGTKTVYCPVSDCRVDGNTCLEITVVADGEINASILPDTIVWNAAQREKCLHCKWHDDIG